jgi:hypothetical protein
MNDHCYFHEPGSTFKCLALYHSKELEAQVKRFVLNPKRTYRQDNPGTR